MMNSIRPDALASANRRTPTADNNVATGFSGSFKPVASTELTDRSYLRVPAGQSPLNPLTANRHSSDQHAIAVTKESISFGDGLAIGFENEFATGEGGNQHQQR
jgi:hypothetical protein